MRFTSALVWIGLAALGASPAVAAERAPKRKLTATLRERAVYRVDRAEPFRGASVLRLTLRTETEVSPERVTLHFGDVGLLVPLTRGRHRGRLEGSDLRVNARVRRGRVRLAMRAPRGAVLGDRVLELGSRVGGPVYALEMGGIALDDEPVLPFAVAAYGRADYVRGRAGSGRYRVQVRADAMLPGDAAAAPSTRLIPDRRGSPWRGRVQGHCLTQGETPLVTWRLDGGVDVLVEPLDAEADDLGTAFGDEVRRVGDGVVALDLPSGTVAQTRFDFAVPAAEGVHELMVRATDATGLRGVVRREFTVDAPAAPTLLDAGLHVLEQREGALWAWGENDYGEVGDGTRRVPLSPVPLDTPVGVTALAAGADFSLAVDASGDVWMWGDWERTREPIPGVFATRSIGSRVPVLVDGLTGVVAVAGGEDHALALDDRGRVLAWGDNSRGQLGDGTTKSRARRPERVSGLPAEVIAIAATDEGSFALDRDGLVWAWGESGLVDVLDAAVPEEVIGLPPIAAIDARGLVLCLAEDGTVWTWGDNRDGELGDGTTLDRPYPGLVLGLRDIVQVSAGDFHSLALRSDGVVLGWGDNGAGELGDGTSLHRRVPVVVRGVEGVELIVAGTFMSFAVTADGALWTWGLDVLEEGPVGEGGMYPHLAKRAFEPGHQPRDNEVGVFYQFKR